MHTHLLTHTRSTCTLTQAPNVIHTHANTQPHSPLGFGVGLTECTRRLTLPLGEAVMRVPACWCVHPRTEHPFTSRSLSPTQMPCLSALPTANHSQLLNIHTLVKCLMYRQLTHTDNGRWGSPFQLQPIAICPNLQFDCDEVWLVKATRSPNWTHSPKSIPAGLSIIRGQRNTLWITALNRYITAWVLQGHDTRFHTQITTKQWESELQGTLANSPVLPEATDQVAHGIHQWYTIKVCCWERAIQHHRFLQHLLGKLLYK